MEEEVEEVKRIFNNYGENFVKMEEKNLNRKYLSKIVVSMLGNVKNKKILDAGCGSGRECKILAKKGAEVIGIDISEKMISLAKERCKGLGVKFYIGDMEKIKFKEKNFDIIIAIFSIIYKKDLKKLFGEFRRILKKYGKLLIVVPHPVREMLKYKKNYFDRKKYWKVLHDMRVFNYFWAIEDYINILVSKGFVLNEIKEPEPKYSKGKFYPHYLILKSELSK